MKAPVISFSAMASNSSRFDVVMFSMLDYHENSLHSNGAYHSKRSACSACGNPPSLLITHKHTIDSTSNSNKCYLPYIRACCLPQCYNLHARTVQYIQFPIFSQNLLFQILIITKHPLTRLIRSVPLDLCVRFTNSTLHTAGMRYTCIVQTNENYVCLRTVL